MDQNPSAPTDRAVVPVIGVVLLVAVTVLLIGSVGAFLIEFTQDAEVERPPHAVFTIRTADCGAIAIRVLHVGGENVPADQLSLRSRELDLAGNWANPVGYTVTRGADGIVSAGDSARICAHATPVSISVIWRSSDGHHSFILSSRTIDA